MSQPGCFLPYLNIFLPLNAATSPALKVGIKVDDALAQETFARVDRGGHHKISWAELWAAMAPTPSDVLKELRVAMHKKRMTVAELIRPYDSNVDYVLTEGEFHRLLDGLGFQLDDAEVRHILHLIDLDGNRTISCKELEYALELRGGNRDGVAWFARVGL
jgi:Ca2+-binding EF-hand superfamily protein